MLRTRALEVSLWEAVLPEEVLRLPEELARVDVLLDDPVFFAPFTPFFDPRLGRPSTPMEVYLRLMFLKFRYRLGYETLARPPPRPGAALGRPRRGAGAPDGDRHPGWGRGRAGPPEHPRDEPRGEGRLAGRVRHPTGAG